MSRNNSNFNLRGFDVVNTSSTEGIRYPTPINLNVLWSFGFLLLIYLLIQIVTGILLAIHYVPTVEGAFGSVTHIMYEVQNGSFIRYMHSNGASMFLLCVYIHISKAIYYFSYLPPRVAVWVTGVILFLLICATAFTGYVLPWGQMSLWGATVIINFFTAIPVYGAAITKWIVGGHAIGTATLQRFFIFHVVTPFIILILSFVHIYLLHKVGSSNPTIFGEVEPIPFYPYFFLKDLQILSVSLMVYIFFVCYAPDVLGHPDNYIQANPLVTPKHIVPEWYFLPFYAILRSIPSKMGGVVAMLFSILVWFVIPFYKTSREKMMKSLPVYHIFVWFFFCDFLALGWIGAQPVAEPFIMLGQAFTIYYFLFFLIIIPFYPYIDTHFFAPILAFLRNLLTKAQLTDGYHVLNKENEEYHYIFYNYFFIKTVLRNFKETLNKFFKYLKLSKCEKFVTFFFDTFISLCFKYARYAVKREARSRRVPKLNFKMPTRLPYKPIQTYGGFSKMTSVERAKACPSLNRRVPFEVKKQSNILPFFVSITVIQEYVSYDYLLVPEIIIFVTAFFLLLWSYIHPRSFWYSSILKINNGILLSIFFFFLAFLSRLFINFPLLTFKEHAVEQNVFIETVYFLNSLMQSSFMEGFFEASVQIFLYFLSFLFLIIVVQSPQGNHYYCSSAQKFSTFYFLFSLSTIGLSLLLPAKHLVVVFLLIELISLSLILLMAQTLYRSVQMTPVFFYFFVSFLGTVFFLFFCLTYYALFDTYLLTEINITNLFNLFCKSSSFSSKTFLSTVCSLSLFFFFSVKLGLFPFAFWVRNVYANLPFIFLSYLIPVVKSIYWFFFTKCFMGVIPLLFQYQTSSLILLSILLIFSLIFSIFFLVRETLIKGVVAYLSIISNIFFLAPFCTLEYSSFFLLNVSWFFNIIYSLVSFYFIYFFTTISLVDNRVTKSNQPFGLSSNSSYLFLAEPTNKTNTMRVVELSYITDLYLISTTSLQCKLIFSILLISVMALPPFPIFFAKLWIFLILFYTKSYYMLFLICLSSIVSAFYYIRLAKVSFFDKNKIFFFNINILEHNKRFNLVFFFLTVIVFLVYFGPMLFPFISIFLGMV
ncbi:MAG: cytochrome b N-terminal domain-containing protein [Pyrinomonadaceae bacterium]|nr:cytochrome b N-terminal domain-containing protein [Pyrinomonadaceae bacterium]